MGTSVLANRLRQAREAKGITQIEAARLIGIRNQTLSAYELAKREPDCETLAKMANVYGYSADYLIGLVDHPAPYPASTSRIAVSLIKYIQAFPITTEDVEAVKDLLEARRIRRERKPPEES